MNASGHYRCTYKQDEVVVSAHTSFGLVDSKGRELGASTRIWPLIVGFGPIREWHMFKTDLPPGLYFEVVVHVTRDEQPFGASPRRHVLDSVEAAHGKAAELVASAWKRYVKQAANGGIK